MFKVDLSLQDQDKLLVQLLFYSNGFIDSPNLGMDQIFSIDSDSQTKFAKIGDVLVDKRTHFYLKPKLSLCEVNIAFSFLNKQTKRPFMVTSDDQEEILLIGTISSQKCQISLAFTSEFETIDHTQAIVITILCLIFQLANICGIFRVIRPNNNNQTVVINDWIIGLHVAMDFALFYFNLFFGTSYLPGYCVYLILIGFVHFVSSFIKNFLFGRQLSVYLAQGQHTQLQRKIRRALLFLKIFFVLVLGISFSIFLFEFSVFYYIFFLYPMIQVVHNCIGMSREQCFIWWLHTPFFTSYIFFFSCLKGFDTFFNFEYSKGFVLIICSEVFLCLIFMILQRMFDPFFFLPKSLRPGYYNYYRKFETHQVEAETTCAICLLEIHSDPLKNEDKKSQENLLHDSFMETPCGHRFHSECLKEWILINQTCPLCKKKIPLFK